MTFIRRVLGSHGAHRPGFVRPLSDVKPKTDPWAAAEADHWSTDTMLLPVIA